MALALQYGVGIYAAGQAGEGHTAIASRLYRPDGTKRPVIWMHSAGGNNREPADPVNNVLPIIEELAARVGPLISFDGAAGNPAQHWGNDFAQARVTDAKGYLQSAAYGAKAGKALLIGVSMGGLLALNYARANPGLVQAVALLYPAVNLQWIHDNGGAATTEAAYGASLANFNAAVAAHNPQAHAGEYPALGIPMKMWRATGDNTVSTAEQDAFASAAGVPKVSLGAVGHADMTAVPISELRDFLLANA